MDIRRLVLVGNHSSPEDFENYALIQLLKRKPLELSAQDDQTPAKLESFIFRIRETHHSPFFWVNVTDEAGNWIRIDAVDNKVSFDLYPGVA